MMEKTFVEGFVEKFIQTPFQFSSSLKNAFPTYWLPLTFAQNYYDKKIANLVRLKMFDTHLIKTKQMSSNCLIKLKI